MRRTIRLIGSAIKSGSHYAPIRLRAARLAAQTAPKDYLSQARNIFRDFVRRWRYVKDPADRELVTISPAQIYETVMGGDEGRGYGDCDDAAVALGAQLASVGFPVRIATIAPQNARPGNLFSHVFVRAHVPRMGWVTVDPVPYPEHGFGYTPPHSRLVEWDLNGNIISAYGNAQGLSGNEIGDTSMLGDINEWKDYAGLGDYTELPADELPDFRQVGIRDFGLYADNMGMMGGLGLLAEVQTDATGRAWTPALEVAPHDYQYLKYHSTPYHGMLALGDDGGIYRYDGMGGFFSRLFKKAKKAVSGIAKKVLKKIPGGKYLLRLGSKVWGIAKKLVRPLAKLVGPLATKLAPVAALIPGYGPAISAALYTTGKIANLMRKYDVAITGDKGDVRKLRFKSGRQAKAFQAALKKAAHARLQAQKAKGKSRARKISRPPIRSSRRGYEARV